MGHVAYNGVQRRQVKIKRHYNNRRESLCSSAPSHSTFIDNVNAKHHSFNIYLHQVT